MGIQYFKRKLPNYDIAWKKIKCSTLLNDMRTQNKNLLRFKSCLYFTLKTKWINAQHAICAYVTVGVAKSTRNERVGLNKKFFF